MRELILATGAIATAMALSPGHAADAVPWKPYVVKTLAIGDRGDLPGKLVDATVSLIGGPAAKTFGLSYQGTLAPDVEMTGTEKLLIYLYAACDDKAPIGTSAINVGTVDIGTLKKGRQVSTTKEASALVPLIDVECATLGIDAGEDAADKDYMVKTVATGDGGDLPGQLVNASVSLIGEPTAKTFALSYQGTLEPNAEMTGTEKLLVYLYAACDDKAPTGTSAIYVGTVDIGTLKRGRQISMTSEARAVVALSDVECATLEIDAGDAEEDAADEPDEVKTFAMPDRRDLPGIKVDATVRLIGPPESKSFGVSYKGTLDPETAMTGEEEIVLYLYTRCDDQIPSKSDAMPVAEIEIGTLKEGREVSTLIATEAATALVPLSQIECAELAMQ